MSRQQDLEERERTVEETTDLIEYHLQQLENMWHEMNADLNLTKERKDYERATRG